jgi:hypothetical protein
MSQLTRGKNAFHAKVAADAYGSPLTDSETRSVRRYLQQKYGFLKEIIGTRPPR